MALQLPNSLGPWQPKVTRIQKMWAQPCLINPMIWFAGYFAASPVLLGSILAPDCLDATADRVRAGHRRRRRGSVNVADYAKPIAPPDKASGWVAFGPGALAQRIGWYFLLADATLDWVIHGTSLAFQFSGCQDPNQGRAQLSMTNQVPLLLPATESILFQWHVDDQHIFSAGPAGIATPKGHAVGCGFTITQHTNQFPGLPDCSFYCRVIDSVAGKAITGNLIPQDNGDGTRSITWAQSTTSAMDKTHHFQIFCVKTFGVMYVSGNFTCSGANMEGATSSACGHNIPGV